MRKFDHDSAKYAKLSALIATAAAVGESPLEATDFLNVSLASPFTVGWQMGELNSTRFEFDLKDGKKGYFGTSVFDAAYMVTGRTYGKNLNFKFRVYDRAGGFAPLNHAFKLFDEGQTWNDIGTATQSNHIGNAGMLFLDGGFKSLGPYPEVTDKYLLFKFTNNGEDYFGWFLVDMANQWADSGSGQRKLNLFVTIHAYAWHSGPLVAGAVAVPEPSTLVTSGIAALAGGAVALRRWRRERKAKTDVA